jgi:hypothetical protein
VRTSREHQFEGQSSEPELLVAIGVLDRRQTRRGDVTREPVPLVSHSRGSLMEVVEDSVRGGGMVLDGLLICRDDAERKKIDVE